VRLSNGVNMKIKIKSTNIILAPNIKDYLEEKILSCEKFLNTKFDVPAQVEIEKSTHHKKGKVFRVEINLKLPKASLRIESTGEDVYFTITDLKDKLQRALKKYKEKKASEFKKTTRKSINKSIM